MTDSPTTTSLTSSDASNPSSGGCVSYDGGALTVCYGHAVEVSRRPDPERETRWCFGCRARLPHEFVVYADPSPSYYDPTLAVECTRCGKEDIWFPGCGPL